MFLDLSQETEMRTCFVIAPVGRRESRIRRQSDAVFKTLIEPAVGSCGYKAIRADQLSEPGMITEQIIEHLIRDQLAIADLSGRNANVFYELGIRHAFRRPVIQIQKDGETLPFDISLIRTLRFRPQVQDLRLRVMELTNFIRAIEKDANYGGNPIPVSLDSLYHPLGSMDPARDFINAIEKLKKSTKQQIIRKLIRRELLKAGWTDEQVRGILPGGRPSKPTNPQQTTWLLSPKD